jgi:hypothetical protein
MNNWHDYQRLLKESYPLEVRPKNGGYDIFAKGKWVRWFMGLHKPGTVHIVNGEAWFGPDEPMVKTQEDWKRVHPESTWEDFRCHLLMLGYEPIKLEFAECLYKYDDTRVPG